MGGTGERQSVTKAWNVFRIGNAGSRPRWARKTGERTWGIARQDVFFELDLADRAGKVHASDFDPVSDWGIVSVVAVCREMKGASEPPGDQRAAKRLEGHESIAGKKVLCLYRAVAGFA